MATNPQAGLETSRVLAYQKQYHAQKRLADALFGLFRTLGSALRVERVANIGLLTLTGQLLIKCAAFFQRDEEGTYRLLATVGARDPDLGGLHFPETLPQIAVLFRERNLQSLADEDLSTLHESMAALRNHGFTQLFPLADGAEPLGVIALGEKIVPGPLTAEDRQILDAFGVVISVSLKNSVAYQLMEESRNELQRLNEMKNEFLSHVSHELRTPLTILKSTIEMTDVDPEIHEMQSVAVARFEHLINAVILLNEINTHGVRLDRTPVAVSEWVAAHARPMLQKHACRDPQVDVPPCGIALDIFKIDTAIESLIDNAIKFGAERSDCGMEIYLSTPLRVHEGMEQARESPADLSPGYLRPETPADPEDPETLLVIEVHDRGIGIPTHELDAVFQPFTQAANSPTRGVKGAGLGLTMAKRIIDAHGGKIFCRSVVGQGSVFYVALPLGIRGVPEQEDEDPVPHA